MGEPTLDQRNPGRRQVARFTVAGGLDSNPADSNSLPTKFLILKNCLIDRRLGAVVKRPGSLTESTGAGLGVPLGVGEYTAPAESGSMPLNRTLLYNFAGTSFLQKQFDTWSAISFTARCNFATSKQSQFAKLGTNMYIAGGRPARWPGPGTTIDRVGIIAPTVAITSTVNNAVTGITNVSGSQYMYTYYNSTSGLESDWSPLSTISTPITNKGYDLAIPAATAANWDKLRIYRTLDGGAFPYLVTTLNSGTTTYTDTLQDASLTARASDRFDHGLPPENSYLTAKYAQCVWFVDAANPNKLSFSKPYTGTDTDLEYYPINNFVISNEPITALYVTPGKLLLFHPRSISYVSGFSVDDFVFQPFVPGVGTVFPNSISTNGTDLFFLAEQGIVTIPIQGGQPSHLSRPIDLTLQPLLAGSYNAAIYASSCWNPSLRQFIFMINAQSATGVTWEDDVSGAAVIWEDDGSLAAVTWEDDTSGSSAVASMRVCIWGYSPELSNQNENIWMQYEFPVITDDNVNSAYPVFVFHPQPSSDTADPQQDKTFMGLWSGSQGEVRSIFRRDATGDNGVAITSTILTGRIAPGLATGGYKMFTELGFTNSYSDPTSDGLATLSYLMDYDDPQIRGYTGSLVSLTGSSDLKPLTVTHGRHLHLQVVDTSLSQDKILLSEFFIHFRERLRKDSR